MHAVIPDTNLDYDCNPSADPSAILAYEHHHWSLLTVVLPRSPTHLYPAVQPTSTPQSNPPLALQGYGGYDYCCDLCLRFCTMVMNTAVTSACSFVR